MRLRVGGKCYRLMWASVRSSTIKFTALCNCGWSRMKGMSRVGRRGMGRVMCGRRGAIMGRGERGDVWEKWVWWATASAAERILGNQLVHRTQYVRSKSHIVKLSWLTSSCIKCSTTLQSCSHCGSSLCRDNSEKLLYREWVVLLHSVLISTVWTSWWYRDTRLVGEINIWGVEEEGRRKERRGEEIQRNYSFKERILQEMNWQGISLKQQTIIREFNNNLSSRVEVSERLRYVEGEGGGQVLSTEPPDHVPE